MARSGYTLPVFAVAAAKAALMHGLNPDMTKQTGDRLVVELDLLPDNASIPIEQVARLDGNSTLAIARSDPGDNLDLTRNTPIWAWVKLQPRDQDALVLEAGEGLGTNRAGEPAIYRYARNLFEANLLPLIPGDKTVTVTIILPEGSALAQRTSNAAFGIVDGLALLGTSGISKPLSSEEHFEQFQSDLRTVLKSHTQVIFCVGSHGFRVAQQLGLPTGAIAQTGNWIGALLAEAALQGAESVLLLGYQGKLIKLAGGIFNTSSHLADAKLEIIAAAIAQVGGDLATIQAVLSAQTADAAYQYLQAQDLAIPVFQYLAERITDKAQHYVYKYTNCHLPIGTILFDRQGQVIATHVQPTPANLMIQ
jgi:cobalt-precorrin-5B (C1)-methyltransferase